jgi:hypothetical protein
MNLYRALVFIHVAGVLGMSAALVIEWVSWRLLSRSTTYEQGRDALAVWALVARLGAPALIAVVASGIYLARATAAWNRSWVAVAIPTMVVMAIAGALTGPARSRIVKLLDAMAGRLPADLTGQLTPRNWTGSLRLRTTLLLGLVYAMTAKPADGVVAIAVFALAGLIWAVLSGRPRSEVNEASQPGH